MNKLKEFLQLIKISVDLVEKIYGGQSKYQEGMLMLHKARLELQEKIAKGDLDDTPIIEDNFIDILKSIGEKLDEQDGGEVLYEDD